MLNVVIDSLFNGLTTVLEPVKNMLNIKINKIIICFYVYRLFIFT